MEGTKDNICIKPRCTITTVTSSFRVFREEEAERTMENITVFGCNPFNFYNSLVILMGLLIAVELFWNLDFFYFLCSSTSSSTMERIIEIEDIRAPFRTSQKQPSFVTVHNQLLYFNKKVGWKVVNPKVRKQLIF